MKRWLGPADALLQQGAWWVAVLCAAGGRPRAAALAGAAVVTLHLALRRGERHRVAVPVAAAAGWGLLTDSLLVAAGLAAFGGGAASPAWMVGLWGAFGAALTASLARPAAWSAPRLAALAALAGPLAYRAGGALGALEFPAGAAPALLAVSLQWSLGVPLVARLAQGAAPAAGRRGGVGRSVMAPGVARRGSGGWRR